MNQLKNKLIVALDVDKKEKAIELIDKLAPEVDIFKVGIAPFTDFGEAVLDKINSLGKKCFLDLKFHDIPNTVKNAAKAASKKNIFMINFHCLGGEKMLKAAAEGAFLGAKESGNKPPLLLGVTILTSMGPGELKEIGFEGNIEEKVIELAKLAQRAGLDGVVASGKEAKSIKNKINKNFIVVTPGVRPVWASSEDQKRTLTPKEALEEEADYIVVGRPIVQAEDPLEAAKKILQEIN